MPFIHSNVSTKLTDGQKETLKQKLGQAISIIPGKSERWLMLEFTDNCDMYFQGNNNAPSAFIDVKVYGSISSDCANKMTETLCALYESELHIPKDRIYIQYEESDKWGWNGSNF